MMLESQAETQPCEETRRKRRVVVRRRLGRGQVRGLAGSGPGVVVTVIGFSFARWGMLVEWAWFGAKSVELWEEGVSLDRRVCWACTRFFSCLYCSNDCIREMPVRHDYGDRRSVI